MGSAGTLRTVVVGGPSSGKSTLAQQLLAPVRSTDELVGKGVDWSAMSEVVAGWFDHEGPWTVEGVTTARALRKWLRAHPDAGTPCDRVLVLGPKVELDGRQAAMAKGVLTVLNEVMHELKQRGVDIQFEPPPGPEQDAWQKGLGRRSRNAQG